VGDIDFKVISATENSNKFQKPRFWKEKSVETVVGNIWAKGRGHTSLHTKVESCIQYKTPTLVIWECTCQTNIL